MAKREVIVVGGGIGGLAAGCRLMRRGYEVGILEASDRPAGRMATLERRGDRLDVGAQVYHTNGHRTLETIDAVGLSGAERPKAGYKVRVALRNGDAFVHDPRAPYTKLYGFKGNLNVPESVRVGGNVGIEAHASFDPPDRKGEAANGERQQRRP